MAEAEAQPDVALPLALVARRPQLRDDGAGGGQGSRRTSLFPLETRRKDATTADSSDPVVRRVKSDVSDVLAFDSEFSLRRVQAGLDAVDVDVGVGRSHNTARCSTVLSSTTHTAGTDMLTPMAREELRPDKIVAGTVHGEVTPVCSAVLPASKMMHQDVQVFLQCFDAFQESAARTSLASSPRPGRIAQLILTHKTPHSFQCERVCLRHVHFLIRVLPKGRVTPTAALRIKEMANMIRRSEEKFCFKTYAQFQELHASLLRDGVGVHSCIGHVPDLPSKAVVPDGIWGRMFVKETRNPGLELGLQSFLDILTSQLPNGQLGGNRLLSDFFAGDQVPLSHALVQQVILVRGVDFPGFA